MGLSLRTVELNCKKTYFSFLTYVSFFFFSTKRYARWSLGFVDPPLSVSGTGNNCKISALNTRGQVLLEPVLDAMNNLLQDGILADVQAEGDVINVIVSPAAEVGSFSEEERSRQVRWVYVFIYLYKNYAL